MKEYNKPEIKEEEVILLDVIAESTQSSYGKDYAGDISYKLF